MPRSPGWQTHDTSRNHAFPRCAVPATIGKVVRRARTRRHMSQVELAERAKVTRHTIMRLEAGGHTPNSTLVHALEHILGFGSRGLVPDWMDAPNPERPSRGELARRVRKERGLVLTAVAEASGLSAATISRFERGLSDAKAIVDPDDNGIAAFHNDLYAIALGFKDAAEMRAALRLMNWAPPEEDDW